MTGSLLQSSAAGSFSDKNKAFHPDKERRMEG